MLDRLFNRDRRGYLGWVPRISLKLRIVEILKLGIIGLAFLLAALAYMLVREMMEHETPSGGTVGLIALFMCFELALVKIVDRHQRQEDKDRKS